MTHSIEIRERAVDAYLGGAGSYEYVAGLFATGSASLKRWVRKKREKGTVDPEPRGGGPKPLVDENGLKMLRRWLSKKSDMTLPEIRDKYNGGRRSSVSVSTIGRAVRERLGLPRKKKPTGRRSATKQKHRH